MNEIFYRIQKCLNLIPHIVVNVRMQHYYNSMTDMEKLIRELAGLSDFVISQTDYEEMFLGVLKEILEQQEKQDYILMSDILDDDLGPLLQEIQLALINENQVQPICFWEENLECIKKKDVILYQELLKVKDDIPTGMRVGMAANGQSILLYQKDGEEYCMHSTTNPEWEGEWFIRPFEKRQEHSFVIYGMGLGYHVLAALRQSSLNKVVVLEQNIWVLKEALKVQNFVPYLEQGRLEITYCPDIISLLAKMGRGEDMVLLIHYPSLRMLEESREKELLENYFVETSSMMEQGKLLEENFVRIQKEYFPEAEELESLFLKKDVILVAGGPSVDLELETLRKGAKDVIILAVGTIARTLLENGIRPDAIVISDPQEDMHMQIDGLNVDIPLLLLSTAAYSVVQAYSGPIYVVYQNGYSPAEEIAERNGFKLFNTGGSVTTLALDLCLQMGARRIILVGTDMAYTNGYSHATSVGRKIPSNAKLKIVEAVGGGTVETIKNLNIYRIWIEKRIQGVQDVEIYNTAKGAKIHGTIEDCLEKILKSIIKDF